MSSASRASLVTVLVALVLGAGLAAAGSVDGPSVGGVPVFALAVVLAFAVQFAAFIPAAALRTERFFDLTGSLTFIGVTLVVLLLTGIGARAVVIAAMVVVWAARLGAFLFARVRRDGSDGRFDEIRTSPLRFLRVWTMQGLWVSVTASAAWIGIGAGGDGVDGWLVAGVAVWLVGFAAEATADAQKAAFRRDPANAGRFIRSGLWSVSRHPNYLGEILVWFGVALAALPVAVGWQWIGLLSPVFVFLLLTRVSGIPLLEKRAEARWGDDPEYADYRRRTPVLVPGFSR
ncbi:DUF1295 domain-containing protein [Microbacterium gilvum]|uniref:DUF1295 domain-containing protein n=1 Tax=Microbacterium gilvum TaxID=1336204 RepID=UPI0031E9DDC8